MIKTYEKRIDIPERDKIFLAERATTINPLKSRLEKSVEQALVFLSSPWNTWINGHLAMRQAVLRLVFTDPL